MLAGLLTSLVFIALLSTIVYVYVVYNFSFRVGRSVGDFDVPTWLSLMGIGLLVSLLLGFAQGRGVERALESTAARVYPYARYTGGELMAGGCLAAFSRFLGGNIIVCVAYFLRRTPLTPTQFAVATAIVSTCLAHGRQGVDVLHDGILEGRPQLTERDFEAALSTLRRFHLIEGQSYVDLSSELRRTLTSEPA